MVIWVIQQGVCGQTCVRKHTVLAFLQQNNSLQNFSLSRVTVRNPQTWRDGKTHLQQLTHFRARLCDIKRLNDNDKKKFKASPVLPVVLLTPSALSGASSAERRRRACVYVLPRLRIPLHLHPITTARLRRAPADWMRSQRGAGVCQGSLGCTKFLLQEQKQQYAK